MLNAEQIQLVAGSVIIPGCGVLINLVVRNSRHLPVSTGADILLFLLIFDGTVITALNEFGHLIPYEEFRDAIAPIFGMLIFISFFMWYLSVGCEVRIAQSHNSGTRKYVGFPFWSFVGVWGIAVCMIAVHILVFTLKL